MQIIKAGKEYSFYDNIETFDLLPTKEYKLQEGAFGRLFLEESEPQTLPDKIYSNDKLFIEHVQNVFSKSDDSLGIMLYGKPGLGKSFTAKVLTQSLNLPIVHITKNTHSGMFDLLNKIENPFVVYIDEFEKLFHGGDSDKVSQMQFLSFLDGNNKSNTKKLFIITSNAKIETHFYNRPSRLRYVRSYYKLDQAVIQEIIDDKLEDKSFVDDLIENLDVDTLNIDILVKIIEEVNLTGQPYSQFKSFFNYIVERATYHIHHLESKEPFKLGTKIGTKHYTDYNFESFFENASNVEQGNYFHQERKKDKNIYLYGLERMGYFQGGEIVKGMKVTRSYDLKTGDEINKTEEALFYLERSFKNIQYVL